MKGHQHDSDGTSEADDGRTITGTITGPAFAAWGTGQIAYIRAVTIDGEQGFAINAADGRPLAVVADRDVAVALARQNDLEPLSVH
jgi:hypothetical protein